MTSTNYLAMGEDILHNLRGWIGPYRWWNSMRWYMIKLNYQATSFSKSYFEVYACRFDQDQGMNLDRLEGDNIWIKKGIWNEGCG